MRYQKRVDSKERERNEYAAGYRARFSGIPLSETAHSSWLLGWEDADTEMLESARYKTACEQGSEYAFANTWGLLVDAGGDARWNGVPFDSQRTQPWKEGWVATDISMGVLESELV